MCAIAYYLESEGIMTTAIGLVRENAESMQPPRMLWVPFPLGYPLGRPGDADFQHRVIAHALDLLARPDGPVLEDFAEEAGIEAPETAPACPISFARTLADDGSWRARLERELADLRPWYELGVRRRGRTTAAICAAPERDGVICRPTLVHGGDRPGGNHRRFH